MLATTIYFVLIVTCLNRLYRLAIKENYKGAKVEFWNFFYTAVGFSVLSVVAFAAYEFAKFLLQHFTH